MNAGSACCCEDRLPISGPGGNSSAVTGVSKQGPAHGSERGRGQRVQRAGSAREPGRPYGARHACGRHDVGTSSGECSTVRPCTVGMAAMYSLHASARSRGVCAPTASGELRRCWLVPLAAACGGGGGGCGCCAAGAFLPKVIAAASPMVGQLLVGLVPAGEPSGEPARCSSVGETLPLLLGARPGLRSCANWQREPYAHEPVCAHIPQIMRSSACLRWRASREAGGGGAGMRTSGAGAGARPPRPTSTPSSCCQPGSRPAGGAGHIPGRAASREPAAEGDKSSGGSAPPWAP